MSKRPEKLDLKLTPLTIEYLELFRGWRNQDRFVFVDSRYISKKKQSLWFKKYLKDPNHKIYLILTQGKPIGAIGLKLTPPENPDFGPALIGDRAYLRQGIMQWAYQEIMHLHPAAHYHGVVKKNNSAALNLDLKMGFIVVKTDRRFFYVEWSINPTETIPLLKPSASQKEIQAVTRVLKSGWWGQGPEVEKLEAEFAEFVGVPYAVAVNSATSALHLSVHVLKSLYPNKSNLITTPLTFISTAAVGLYENLEVRFGDIDENTLCLDPQSASNLIDQHTLAIIPVHYAGYLAPTNYSLPIIEDCAHAAGTKGAGLSRLLACWSFHPVKNIATGDGGMITTTDKSLAQELKRLRWLGIDQDTWARQKQGYNWEYHIPSLGFKYHFNDIQAAIARIQLKRLPQLNRHRSLLAKRYSQHLHSLPLTLPQKSGSWHLYVVRLHNPDLRPTFIEYLRGRSISVGVHYQPLHHYPLFNWSKPLPITDCIYPTLVDLPIFPDLTLKDQDYIIKTIKDFFKAQK